MSEIQDLTWSDYGYFDSDHEDIVAILKAIYEECDYDKASVLEDAKLYDQLREVILSTVYEEIIEEAEDIANMLETSYQ